MHEDAIIRKQTLGSVGRMQHYRALRPCWWVSKTALWGTLENTELLCDSTPYCISPNSECIYSQKVHTWILIVTLHRNSWKVKKAQVSTSL